MAREPVVIIGAARSGTNILRDVTVRLPGYGTWPCDEINAIWRYGNVGRPDDEFPPELARAEVSRYIRRAFERIARTRNLERVVEKTCANSLRVGFVDRVLPEARFVFIARDGRDAIASASKRWGASLGIEYTLRKARYVPLANVPHYGFRFARNRLHRIMSKEGLLATWGPRFDGIDEARRELDLIRVCTLQWKACMDRSEEQLAGIAPERVYRMRYEEFATNPTEVMGDLVAWLGDDVSPAAIARMVEAVTASSIGKWKSDLSDQDIESIHEVGGSTLERYLWRKQ